MTSWRTVAIVLAVVCGVQRWQHCTRAEPARAAIVEATPRQPIAIPAPPTIVRDTSARPRSFFGFRPPAWAAPLLPQAGELLVDYRARILPIAEAAMAPQRARVARMRARLPEAQRAALDAAAATTATEIEARLVAAAASGELRDLKPMTGVTLAREILDIVDRGNTQFVTALPADQRAQLAASRFDFADYVMFATPWRDALLP